MSMSHKDVVAIAASIRSEVDKVNPEIEGLRIDALLNIAVGIASHAERSSGLFQRQRFMAACGFEQLA